MPTTDHNLELLESLGIDETLAELAFQLGIHVDEVKATLAPLMPRSRKSEWSIERDLEYQRSLGITN